MKRLRSPSLFWTFAGWFLLVLVLVAALQWVVAIAVIGPLDQASRRDRAELLVRRVANEIVAREPDREAATDILDRYSPDARMHSLMIVLLSPDGTVLIDRRAPPPLRERIARLLGARPAPGEFREPFSASRPAWPGPPRSPSRGPGGRVPGRGPMGFGPPTGRLSVLYRHQVSPSLGEVIAIHEARRIPLGLLRGPAQLLLFLPTALIVAGIAALLLFRTQVRRLHALEQMATRISEGHLDARVADAHGDELGRLGERLNRMAESLTTARQYERETDRQRRQLLADISHELATPLTSIRGYAETLLNQEIGVSAEERTTYLRSIQAEAERLDVLTRDLFELARLEAGAVSLHRVELDWGELCGNTVDRFRPRFEAAGLSLTYTPAPSPAMVLADGRRMEQVIENLLTNTLRYVPAGGRVAVTMAVEDDRRVLTVEDNGPGIPGEDLARVFDRFYRADPSRTVPGSGLGLAIVREIVERHSGRVKAHNRESGGAAFAVEMPSA